MTNNSKFFFLLCVITYFRLPLPNLHLLITFKGGFNFRGKVIVQTLIEHLLTQQSPPMTQAKNILLTGTLPSHLSSLPFFSPST
jgi:hypothetical protein